jgi:hypothetical protein
MAYQFSPKRPDTVRHASLRRTHRHPRIRRWARTGGDFTGNDASPVVGNTLALMVESRRINSKGVIFGVQAVSRIFYCLNSLGSNHSSSYLHLGM